MLIRLFLPSKFHPTTCFAPEVTGRVLVMPQSIVTSNHYRCPPITTSICCSLSTSLPSSIRFLRNRNRVVICMAKERRVKMVAKQIQRELSDMLLTDQVLQYAILPEAALGADRYLSSLTTISDVEVSSDLQDLWPLMLELILFSNLWVVKVYVSVFGDERGKEVAISGLKSKAKYVRGQLGKRMKLRLTPEVRFIEDESLERGSRVIAILDKIKSEKTVQDPEDDSSDPNGGNEEWEDDDPDDDIIYVK